MGILSLGEMETLSTYTTRRLVMAVILTLFLGGFFVASTKLAVDMSFHQQIITVTTQDFAPEIGNLTLTAKLASENEFTLNLTFHGTVYVTQQGYVWRVWISRSLFINDTNLPEGLMLIEGSEEANGTCPLPNNSLSIQAKLRAIVDGEWIVWGRFSANRGPGDYYGLTTAIRVTVSNGRIIQIGEEQATPPGNEEGGELQKARAR